MAMANKAKGTRIGLYLTISIETIIRCVNGLVLQSSKVLDQNLLFRSPQ